MSLSARIFGLILIPILISGCTRESAGEAQLSLSWTDAGGARLSLAGEVPGILGISSWGNHLPPSDLSEVDCLAVAVSGLSANSNTCKTDLGEIDFEHAAGFVSKNEILTLSLPAGKDRLIRLVGAKSVNGSCPRLASMDRLQISQPRVLAEITRDLEAGSVTLEMSALFSGAVVKNCEGPLITGSTATCNLIARGVAKGLISLDSKAVIHMTSGESVTNLLPDHPHLTFADSWNVINSHLVSFPVGSNMESEAARLCRDERVQFVEPVGTDHPTVPFTSTFDNSTAVNTEPVVAVLSTGLDYTHDVFTQSGAAWSNPNESELNATDDDGNGFIDDTFGWNFVEEDTDIADDEGQGTHIAGIVVNEGVDITALPVPTSPIKIMPLRIFDGDGNGNAAMAANAILYAAQNNADVILMPFGSDHHSELIRRAMNYASNRGALLVSAAGNTGTDLAVSPSYPAAFRVPNNVTVAAVTASDNLTPFSNYGLRHVHFAAPGYLILSTLPGNSFGNMSGTSMAAGSVAGAAALAKTGDLNLSGYQIKQVLLNSLDGLPNVSGKLMNDAKVNRNTAITGVLSIWSTPYDQPTVPE